MAKKFKLDLKTIIGFVGLLFGVLALIMGAAKAVTFTEQLTKSTSSASGFNVAFGWKRTQEALASKVTTEYSGFSFPYFLALFLPLIAGLLLVVNNKICSFVSAGLFAVAAILAFCACPLLKASLLDNVAGNGVKALYDVDNAVKLGAGAIMTGIFSILGALSGVGKALMK